MTEKEAIKLIAEYDNAVGDCEKRPRSKAAGKRFQEVFKRLIAAMVTSEVKCPCCDGESNPEDGCVCVEDCPNS